MKINQYIVTTLGSLATLSKVSASDASEGLPHLENFMLKIER